MTLKKRKLEAFALKQRGMRQKEIAKLMDVSPATISLWLKSVRHGEMADKKRGRPRKLDEHKLIKVDEFLKYPPKEHRIFAGSGGHHRWTNAHVIALIKREFNVVYSERHIRRLLPQMGINGKRLKRSRWRRYLYKHYVIQYAKRKRQKK